MPPTRTQDPNPNTFTDQLSKRTLAGPLIWDLGALGECLGGPWESLVGPWGVLGVLGGSLGGPGMNLAPQGLSKGLLWETHFHILLFKICFFCFYTIFVIWGVRGNGRVPLSVALFLTFFWVAFSGNPCVNSREILGSF